MLKDDTARNRRIGIALVCAGTLCCGSASGWTPGAALPVLPLAWAQWQWPDNAQQWTLLVLCGLFGGIGHHAVATAHRYASAAVLGPFIYLQILYMSFFGWLIFAQLPDAWVIGGASVVVASGLYLLALEMRRG